MIDYAEIKLHIYKLNEQVYSNMISNNTEAAQEIAEKLEMASMMLKKYIDYMLQCK